MNRAAVVDARFVRHRGEWRNLDFASRERLDVKPQQMLDRLERETGAAAEQCFITAARFEREVTATRARVCATGSEPATRPCFKLLDGYAPQRTCARAETSECGLAIDRGNLFRQRQHTQRERERSSSIWIGVEQSNKPRTAAHKSD